MTSSISRRNFLSTTAAAGVAASALRASPLAAGGYWSGSCASLRVLSIGVVGTIGGKDRKEVAGHPDATIVGLCDVDSKALAKASEEHPDAFTCADYREAFRDHADKFDAVIVSTPDHSHAPIMLTALANDKHVYGQKPLVHQLEEIVAMENALAAKPKLVTQLGNQRMVYPGRRAAVEILRQGQLGKALEAHVWTGSPGPGRYFNAARVLHEPSKPPEHLDWNLWLGPCAEAPYREGLAPIVWRSWWDYGTNGLGDWGCHLLDVILFAYDELQSPNAVMTHCPFPGGAEGEAAGHFHAHPCQSTITYAVGDDSKEFAHNHFSIHYNDRGQMVSRASLGLPADAWLENNCTVVVCENGTLVVGASGRLGIWRDGVMTKGLEMPDLPEFPKLNHWHAWVDNCLGRDTELRTPFSQALRITEPALLAVKATRFPGVELRWDKANLVFSNHEDATAQLVRRKYREGFELPGFGG